jgi:hypothetical protein
MNEATDMTNPIKVFSINRNADTNEGRGPMVTMAYMNSKEEALKVVDDPRFARYCVQGIHRPGSEHSAVAEINLHIYQTAEQFWNGIESQARRAALAKLTAEDRKLLGLE